MFKLIHGRKRPRVALHNTTYSAQAILASLLFTTTTYAADNTLSLDLLDVNAGNTSTPLQKSTAPEYTLNGQALTRQRASTLGETLNNTPGISATQYGPNASRPVVRGLDADRVKIMQNGVGNVDASSLSADHAVSIDPLVIEQIEVIRGPAALLYSHSAVGGAINAVDHRIPTEPLNGALGRAEARFGGAEYTRNGAAVVDVGNGQFALHVDAFARQSDNLSIPGFAVSNQKAAFDGTPQTNKGTLINSSASSNGGAIGASLTLDNGYIGASISNTNNHYGTVAEPDVRIDMRTNRWDIASEFSGFSTWINRVKTRLAYTDYKHQELENGEVGTTFTNNGLEGTFELGHQAIGPVTGLVGLQFQHTQFGALGSEALVPTVLTQSQSLYLLETLPLHNQQLTVSARLSRTSVDSRTDSKFGAGKSRDFNPISVAIGHTLTFTPEWSLTSTFSHNERAPSYFELYADGTHVATGQYQIGNTQLSAEKSNGVDTRLQFKQGKIQLSLAAFYTQFNDYIGAFNTGTIDPASGLPIAQYAAVPAVFKGLEIEGKANATEQLTLNFRGDYVHATQTNTHDYLPRIAPLRLGVGAQYTQGGLDYQLDVLHAFKQTHTAQNELPTKAYTNLSANVNYRLPSRWAINVFAKANNLLNQDIRDSTSYLKDIAPSGGRSLTVGVRADF
jgi:iron complex outermembrane recepter protein